MLIILFLLIFSLFLFSTFNTPREQIGGRLNYENGFLSELKEDRDRYFKYSGGAFPYLNGIQEIYEDNLTAIRNRQKKIERMIEDHDKTTKLLVNLGKHNEVKPLYSESDLKRKDKEILSLNSKYNEHLNAYLELSGLNNQLLLLYLYSKNENADLIDKLTEKYRKSKKYFLKYKGKRIN